MVKNMKKGIFISIEGIDGSGKSTLIHLLKKELSLKRFLFTREPGGTGLKITEDIRKIILDINNVNIHKETEALLYAASRKQHINELILPTLERGVNVICDRFVDSSFVYQGVGRNLGIAYIEKINDDLRPDLTILLDLSVDKMKERLENRIEFKEKDRLDNESILFYKKTRLAYQKLAKNNPKRFIIIDAEKTPEKIKEEVLKIIKEKTK